MPEYKIEIPDEKLIRCMAIINRKSAGRVKSQTRFKGFSQRT